MGAIPGLHVKRVEEDVTHIIIAFVVMMMSTMIIALMVSTSKTRFLHCIVFPISIYVTLSYFAVSVLIP
jgi:hypothetical protein